MDFFTHVLDVLSGDKDVESVSEAVVIILFVVTAILTLVPTLVFLGSWLISLCLRAFMLGFGIS